MKTHSQLTLVLTDKANKPSGHYSQAVVAGGTVYVSGQVGSKPGGDRDNPGTVAEQTKSCLDGISGILQAAGSDLSKVVKITAFITRAEHWGPVNEALAKVFGDHRPARSIIPCGELYFGHEIEMEAIAVL